MKRKEAWFHFRTGVWVLIFAIIPTAVLMVVVTMIQMGIIKSGGEGIGGTALVIILAILTPILIVLYLIISGWASRKGVGMVKR